MKIKKIFKIILGLLPIGLLAASCVNNNSNYEDFYKKIIGENGGTKVYDKTQKEMTDKITNKLLSMVFKRNEAEKINFLKKQNSLKNKKKVFEEIKKLSLELKKTDYKNKSTLRSMTALYSENWYLILRNLSAFNANFSDWFILEEVRKSGKTIKMSDQYLNNLKSLTPYKPFKWNNNYLNQAKESEASSSHSQQADIFIKKDKALLNMAINYEKNGETKNVVFYPYIYYFPKAKEEISIDLISNVFHRAVIHKEAQAYESFEENIIKKYGYGEPAVMVLNLSDYEEN